MIHGRYNNNKIKNLHERCLRLTCCDKTSSYEKLIEKDDSVSIHLEIETSSLEIEIYNVKYELAPTITVNIFGTIPENHYYLKNYNDFRIPFSRTIYHVTEASPI